MERIVILAAVLVLAAFCLASDGEPACPPEGKTTWADAVGAIASALLALAAGAGALIAWMGLHTWRQHLKGKTEYDLARRVLRAAYNVRYATLTARHRLRKMSDDESKSKLATDALKQVFGAISELRAETTEAEVVWGHDIGNKETKVEDRVAESGDAAMGKDAAAIRRVLHPGETDDFQVDLDASVADIGEYLKPYLKL